jgi:hypothetical protein
MKFFHLNLMLALEVSIGVLLGARICVGALILEYKFLLQKIEHLLSKTHYQDLLLGLL